MKKFHAYFLPTIVKHYPHAANEIISKMDLLYLNIYDPSLSTSNNPIDKRLSFSAYFLALIQSLDERGESYDQIRQVCLQVAHDFVQPKNGLQRLIKTWPSRFIQTWFGRLLIQNLKKETEKPGHPDGFVARILTDKESTYDLGYGIDILQCGICKQFQKQNYAQFTSILCEVDYMTTNLAGLEMIRYGTIAQGADICDFRYKKKK